MSRPDAAAPLFTVVVPTRGAPEDLRPTLAGFAGQRFGSFELLVINDGGAPETEALVAEAGDARVRYLWKPHGGRGAARNHGARLARGAYVCFFDADDVPGPEHLATAAGIVRQDAPPAFHLDFEVRAHGGAPVRAPGTRESRPLQDELLAGNPFGTGGVFLERRLTSELEWSEDPGIATSEDWLLWLRVAARFPILAVAGATWTVLEHPGRTFHHLTGEKMAATEEKLCAALAGDPRFMERWGARGLKRVRGRMATTRGLVHALAAERGPALRHLARGAILSPRELTDRRALAILRRSLIPGSAGG